VGAVGDAVAEGDDGGAVAVGEDVNSFEEVPAEKLLWGVERGGGDYVARDEVVRLVGEGVEGELIYGLVGEEDADGEAGERSDFEGDWIADHQGAGGNDDGCLSAEGERGSGSRDSAGARAEGNLRRADGERVEAEFVGEDDPDRASAERDVDDLPEGGAGCPFCSELGGGIAGRYGRGGPGSYPVVRGGGSGRRCGEAVEAKKRESGEERSFEMPGHDRP
jgi:hypothetical protein